MNWEVVATAIGGLSLLVGGATFVQKRQSELRNARAVERARLGLSCDRLNDNTLLVEVTYRPLREHTRYSAVLRVVKPGDASLSDPGWADHSSNVFFAMPSPAFDATAQQRRSASLELTEYWPFGGDRGVGARIVAHAAGGLPALVLDIKIRDAARDKTVLALRETLTD